MTTNRRSNEKIRRMALLAMFSAIIFLLGMTPLGMIPLPILKATTLHIPVIIGAILLGPVDGAILGGIFGLVSFLNNSFISPNLTSFVFTPFYSFSPEYSGNLWSLVVCFVPRIMVGVTAAWVFRLIGRWDKSKIGACAAAGVLGSAVNTLLVFGGIALFFGQAYANAKGGALMTVISGIIVSNGIPEAIAAGILAVAVCKPLMVLAKRRKA